MGIFKTLFGAAIAVALPPEVTGKALLKQTVKQYGVDIGRISENAWDQLTKGCIDQANNFVAFSKVPGMEDKGHFHGNLVDAVTGTAVMISESLDPKSRSPLAEGPVRETLIRHGVLKS